MKKSLRTCAEGHQYYKSSDCPVCPICEKERKPKGSFLTSLAAPARRALENKGILTLQQLAGHNEKEILQLHGMGPGSMQRLTKTLQEVGLSFRKQE